MATEPRWITPEQERMLAAVHGYLRSIDAPTNQWLTFSTKVMLTPDNQCLIDDTQVTRGD